MLIKVHGGTPADHNESLCDTCRHAKTVRGQRLDEQIVFCRGMSYEPVRIGFRVASCSEYDDGREPTYHELLEKAWILDPPTNRRTAGFVRVSDLDTQATARLFTEVDEED
jgi:hypothetical protein